MRAPPVWLFDLDNTLHNAQDYFFPQINQQMTMYLQQHLALSHDQANTLRVKYWQQYGATLTGLMRHHKIKPHHFLWHTHQFPALRQHVQAEMGLRHTLRRLRGRKIVFSNAPYHYVWAILTALRITHFFSAIISLERTKHIPKPNVSAFHHALKRLRLLPTQCVFVEDTLTNLKTAKRLGMRTIFLHRPLKRPRYVDRTISHLRDLTSL